jgi:hypothetical protein
MSKERVSILKGIFKIGKQQSNNLGDILDAHSECCAGVNCCKQVLILKDLNTNERMVGYFYDGVWTTKTLADFTADGPAPPGP